MVELIVKDHHIASPLPEGFTFDAQTLSIPAKKQFDDPIKIYIKDDNHESLKIVVAAQTHVKIILEVASEQTSKHGYHIELVLKQSAQVKYLLVSELASAEALFDHFFTVDRDA